MTIGAGAVAALGLDDLPLVAGQIALSVVGLLPAVVLLVPDVREGYHLAGELIISAAASASRTMAR